uniref:tumor necrosis factor receptor superfamily member 14 n=1 Tax=Jaculus jaculus TaxID=51337 RepID=UPI001E1AF8C0|nr:tumor necrosis factor receptor superfamily member 14 [Jaculus jaculus]
MESWPSWGPPCWNKFPTANVLMLALCILLLSSLSHVPAQPQCREEEYPVAAECCPKCSAGYHVKQVCSELTGTVCIPCPPKTYTAHPNGLSQCLPCGDCDPDMGMVTWQNCSSTQDTVCHCSQGYFCDIEEGNHCVLCLPHTTCPPGQRVLKRGTYSQNTVCANCLLGTFSSGGTQEKCLPWTKCQQWFQKETERGTRSTDVTCSFSWGFYFTLASLGAITAFMIFCLWKQRRVSSRVTLASVTLQQNRQDKAHKFSVAEDIPTEAVEETALNS